MSIKKVVKKIVSKTIDSYKYSMSKKTHIKTIDDMRKDCEIVPLSPDQIKEIQQLYKKYFKEEINLKWHEYYSSVNKLYSPEYLPTYLYYAKIYPKMNPPRWADMYSDKNLIDKIVPSAPLPETYVKNINGYFYVGESSATFEEAIKACDNLPDAIIKHSIETCQGKSVLRFSSKDGQVIVKNDSSSMSIKELLESYGKNYIVQSAVSQCEKMASLNPTSLNTVRIMTYKRKTDVVVLFAVVRMGRMGTVVDNASAGGLYCGVNEDGSLKKEAYTLTPFSKMTASDNGVVFADFVVPQYSHMVSLVKKWHDDLPYVKLIGWDVAIDENDNIVLIEINAASPGLFQAATGPAFGKYTSEIFDEVKSI